MVTRVTIQQSLNRAAAYSFQKAKIVHKKGNIFWKYGKPTYKIASETLKIYSIKFAKDSKKLDKLTARINLLAIVNFYYDISGLPEKLNNCYEALHVRKDMEGFVFSFLDLLQTLGAITKSVDDLLEAFQTLFDKTGINILESVILKITMPCGAYGTIKDWYNWGHQVYQWQSMPGQIKNEEDLEKLITYLNKKLKDKDFNKKDLAWYDPEKILKSPINNKTVQDRISLRNRVRLEKRTDKRIVNIMKNLQDHLNKNENNVDTANKAVNDMNTLMKRKINVGVCENLVSTALTTASLASLIFTLSPLTFPVLLLSKYLATLIRHTYMNNLYDKKLKSPSFALAPTH